ncbi:chloride channel CLIC-like protein 1 [Tachysurus vachellii]|uniref:chloride channel CLIC-like protein 1 n=1 Tax=Tachysurus vachellii TaxID=175792 RepID=UPI00296AD1E6|nr:chloride channel CLIC-like protein 1 [Tachysurus vachellii]XP_060732870.1 chloride channel CLIC-like protein 1 [Tachysurus vachellii]
MRVSVVLLWGYSGFLVISSFSLFIHGNNNNDDDEWLDPFDMLKYDSTSKRMRKFAEASSYNNVPTKRREYSEDSREVPQCPDMKECTDKVNMLQRQIEEHSRTVTFSSQQPTCNPVFKRFLAKLLKEINKLGLPTAVTAEMHYDAEVKLSRQMVSEIQKLLNDDNGWRSGALDDALSNILINFKLHDYEAWNWRFEDTFGVELNTIIKASVVVFIIVCIICTEMWSAVSWFVQFKRMFAICFFISLVWNWFYLYKISFAEHQAKVIKMENFNGKCTGVKKIDWMDNFKEWIRTTWTLQDDPCKQYYEVLIVNPILLVPPTKAITITMTTFITDPLKHFGKGISEFLRALLQDLPVTLQIPVLLLIGLSILVFIYSIGQAAVHHAVLRPLQGSRQDPLPSTAQQPAAPPLQEPAEHREEERVLLTRGDANCTAQSRHHVGQEVNNVNPRVNQGDNRSDIRQRRPNKQRHEQQRVYVETLRNADSLYSGDKADTRQEAADEDWDQHVEEELRMLSNEQKEENVVSVSSAERETSHGSKIEWKDKTSGNTERDEVGESASRDASKKENCVENIGTPVKDTMHL